MLVGKRFEIGGCRVCKVLEEALSISSAECRAYNSIIGEIVPFRMNITPDHSVGSPGVRHRNTPCGQAYLRLELRWI
jgi:hypothetical protein